MMKVLAVDDEPYILRLAQAHLQRVGFDVVTARDAKEALLKVEVEHPDVILLDHKLPSRDNFIRILKANPATREIPIVSAPDDLMAGGLFRLW